MGPEAQGHGIWKPLGGGADTPGASPKAKAKLVVLIFGGKGSKLFCVVFSRWKKT